MLTYVKGGIVEGPSTVIIHGCNAQGVMGSGVAKAIRDAYPKAYEVYKDTHRSTGLGLMLGSIIPVQMDDGRWVVNAITQEYYGRDGKRYLSYHALGVAFVRIYTLAASNFFGRAATFGIPRIGAGLGGGDWEAIATIIELATPGMNITIYDPNQAA